jgi:hypothetical protein
MVSYDGVPVHQPIDPLAPKLCECAYANHEDRRQAARAILGIDSTDDTSSGTTIVSGLTTSQAKSSMKHQAISRNTIEDGCRAARAFLGNDSTDDTSSSGLTTSQAESSMKHQALSQNTIKDRRRAARAFHGNDSKDDSSSGTMIVSGLSTSQAESSIKHQAHSLKKGDDLLRFFFGDKDTVPPPVALTVAVLCT